MADNQTIPATAFSVSGSADGFSVQGSYPVSYTHLTLPTKAFV